MIKIANRLVRTSDPETFRLHRVNVDPDTYFVAATLLDGETAADFEEVTEWPTIEEESEEEIPEEEVGDLGEIGNLGDLGELGG